MVSVTTAADPHEWLQLQLPARVKADGTFALTLTDDQRLVGTNVTSAGRGGSAVKTVVSAVSTVAGLVATGLGAAARFGALAGPHQPPTWADENPEVAEREQRLRSAHAKAETLHDDLTVRAIDEEQVAARSSLLRRRDEVARLMADLAAELARIGALRSAWNAARTDRRTSTHSFVFDVDDLPTDETVGTWPKASGVVERRQAKSLYGPLAMFGIVVTAQDVTPRVTPTDHPDVAGGAYDGVHYRVPRQVKLRVYRVAGVEVDAEVDVAITPTSPVVASEELPTVEPVAPPNEDSAAPIAEPTAEAATEPAAEEAPTESAIEATTAFAVLSNLAEAERAAAPARSSGGSSAPGVVRTGPVDWLVLVEEREVEVVDKHCRIGFLPFTSAWFGERAATVSFGPLGSPTSISTSNVSMLRDLADLAASVPGQVLTGIETVNKIVDQGQVAWGQADETRLARLEQRKKLLEAQLALSDSEDTAAIRSEVAKLGAEHDLLVAHRDAANATNELAAARSADEARSVLVQQRVERLELEAKVTKLESDAALTAVAHENRLLALRAEAERLEQLAAKLESGKIEPDAAKPVVTTDPAGAS